MGEGLNPPNLLLWVRQCFKNKQCARGRQKMARFGAEIT